MIRVKVIPLSDPRAAELAGCGEQRDGRLVVDKASDCYKAWRRRSRGLGDTIAKLTKSVGVKPCGGCRKRQALLNKLVPYAPPISPP